MAQKAKAGIEVDLNKSKVKDAFKAVMAEEAEIRTLAASHAKRVGNKREKINDFKTQAVDAGCAKKVFELILEKAETKRSIDEKRNALEPQQQDMFDELVVHLKLTDEDDSDPKPKPSGTIAHLHA